MIMTIFFSLIAGILIGCSSNVTDPKTDNVPNGTGLAYKPEIIMYNFRGGDAYQSGSSYKINFKVVDSVMGVNENIIEYKHDSDAAWSLIKDKVLSSSDQLTQVIWNIPSDLVGSDFKLRITAYGKIPASKQIESSNTFVIDNGLPTLNSNGLAGVGLPANNPFLFLKLLSVTGDLDDLSGIGAYCFSLNANEVDNEDRCWVKKTLSISGALPVFAGMLAQSLTPYLHLRDRAGNRRVNTDTNGTDKITLNQLLVTVPTGSDSFYKASSSTDVSRRLGLTIQNTTSSYNYSNFVNNDSHSIDPGLIVYLPRGQVLIRDRVTGLRKVDLVQVCGSEPCSSILVATASQSVDGNIDGTAKLVEPLRMVLSDGGQLWILDRKSTGSAELVIRRIDFNDSLPRLVTMIGGGADESDSIGSPLNLKINYSEGLVFFGAFQSLPNGWLIFQSANPEAALNATSTARYKLRIFKPTEEKQIQSLDLNTKNVYNIASNPGKDMIATSTPAVTFDQDYQNIKAIYLRVCELTLPVASGQACNNSRIIGFDKTGQAQTNLGLSSFVNDGNLVLESPNSVDLYAKSGFSSEFRKYDVAANTWELLAGNGSWGSGYCANGMTNSACALRLKDAYYDSTQQLLFVMDQSKVRFIAPDVNKVFSLIE